MLKYQMISEDSHLSIS